MSTYAASISSLLRPLALGAALLAGTAGLASAQSPTTMRVAGNFSSSVTHSEGIERPFFNGLAAQTGLPLAMNFNPMDVVNVKADDALRLLRSGAFDVMSVQIGQASRDDPFFEGIDLAGVSTNFPDLRKAIDAYRSAFDERLQKKFNAKVLTLWPFGPQVFYCSKPVKSVALKGSTRTDDGLQADERNLAAELAAEKAAKNAKDVLLQEAAHVLADESAMLKTDVRMASRTMPYRAPTKEVGN